MKTRILFLVGCLIISASTFAQNYFAGTNAGASITTGTTNTGVGTSSMRNTTSGSSNAAFGYESLYSNTTGQPSEAFGYHSQYSQTDGGHNVAVGYATLYSNHTAHRNSAVGTTALYYDTVSDNSAYGYQTMYYNVSGTPNEGFGVQALFSNSTGSNNAAFGYRSLYYNNTGDFNTGCGNYALYNQNGGDSGNTALGYKAGYNYSTYDYCTFVGMQADANASGYYNSSAIGYNAIFDANNKVRVGNANVTSIGGQVDWTNFSDQRIKRDIQDNVPGLEFINKLKPVTYHFDIKKENELLGVGETPDYPGKYDIENTQFTGFLAQQVDEAAHSIGYDFSGVDRSGNVMGLRYAEFVVPLVKAVQEQEQKIETQQKTIEQQQQILNDALSRIETLTREVEQVKNCCSGSSDEYSSGNDEPMLYNASPNPTSGSATISYYIPVLATSASLEITNESGTTLKTYHISNFGRSSVTIEANNLVSGVYYYSLVVDWSCSRY